MVKPLKDTFLVSANESENEVTKSGIIIDTSWDKYKHAVQNGIVEEIPLSISSNYKNDVKIKKGDKIYFHHFVVQEDNYIMDNDKKLFKAPYFHIYCKIENGVPVVTEDWVLASAIKESEEDITKTYGTLKLYTKAVAGNKPLMAKVEFMSKTAAKSGLKVGDTIIYKNDADYDMMIEGKEYYRMKMANIGAVIRDNVLVPINDDVVIEDTTSTETTTSLGIILINQKPAKTQKAMVLFRGVTSVYQQGDIILYFHGTGTRVGWAGKHYCILRQEQVMGLVTEG